LFQICGHNFLATYYKGSRLSPVQVWVRFVHPDIAVVHVAWNAVYTKDGKEQSRTALMTLTVTKQEDKWKIAAGHNTLTGGPGSIGIERGLQIVKRKRLGGTPIALAPAYSPVTTDLSEATRRTKG
jgi:Domain of unknown function (DUF4440)